MGVANRPGGYTEELVSQVEPLTDLTALIVQNILIRNGKKGRGKSRPKPRAAPSGSQVRPQRTKFSTVQ